MEERQTLCNMAIEAGGKNGVIPADEVTKKYVDARNAGNRPYTVSTSTDRQACKRWGGWNMRRSGREAVRVVMSDHGGHLSQEGGKARQNFHPAQRYHVLAEVLSFSMRSTFPRCPSASPPYLQIFQADPDAQYYSKNAYNLADLEPVSASAGLSLLQHMAHQSSNTWHTTDRFTGPRVCH